MSRKTQEGVCKECQLRRDIDALRWAVSVLYRLLPMSVRADLRDQSQVYIRTSGSRSNSKRLKRLYLERDALRKQRERYRRALIECGVLDGDL